MTERRMAEIMGKACALDQIWICAERGAKFTSNLRALE
jgi:hypothetical protein